MRFIDINGAPPPPSSWTAVAKRREDALSALPDDALRLAYVRQHSGWSRLKSWLIARSFNKCWYCEVSLTRAEYDVDHYRPKLKVTVDRIHLSGHSGYWWLAYMWTNYRLACQRCNRPSTDESGRARGKQNEFPLQDEQFRCLAPTGLLSSEIPRLLDPCRPGDPGLLLHAIDGEVRPQPGLSAWDEGRARYTIDTLWLSEPTVGERKRSEWQGLRLLIHLTGDNASEEVEARVRRFLQPDHEYSSFFRSVVATYRDKAWVNSLYED